MTSGFVIRRARAEDAAALPEIERSGGERFRALPKLAFVADGRVPTAKEQRAAIANRLVWVVEDAGRVVGFLIGAIAPDALHIDEVSVHLDFQGRGAGRRLIAAIEQEAVVLEHESVTLTTFRTVAWNAPFYARLGFVIEDRPNARLQAALDDEVARGFDANQRCAMRKSLT